MLDKHKEQLYDLLEDAIDEALDECKRIASKYGNYARTKGLKIKNQAFYNEMMRLLRG